MPDIAARAAGYGIPGEVVDGMDVFAVADAAARAIARARRGEGPTLLECKTYRYYGHFEGDTIKYRTRAEEQSYRERDPIAGFRRRVLAEGLLAESRLAAVDERVRATLEQAKAFARESPLPEPEECLDDVYATQLF